MLDVSATSKQPVSLLMLDVDHFKRVNDVYGHHTGDEVLRKVTEQMEAASAPWNGRIVGRWGGEEFFVVLPNARESEAMMIAERIRRAIERHEFPEVGRVTISIGVITITGDDNRQKAFTDVDNALYKAKQNGRNRCVYAGA